MSLVLPPLFHWSPVACRAKINKRGLRPTCPTAATFSPPIEGTTIRYIDRDATVKAVCLGTTPSHAWSLSGAIFAERHSEWDLWQICLDEDDEVHPLPFFGNRLDEIRVANRIPKSRVWFVATRKVPAHGRR